MAHKPRVIANWFLSTAALEGEALTQMELQKLVYIAHGWHLALLDEPLIDEVVEAWKWGPVIPSLYRSFARFGASAIPAESMKPTLPEKTESLLNDVWEVYKRFTAAELSAMTHKPNTPWSLAFKKEIRNIPISNDSIKLHYNEMKNRS